MFPLDQVLKCAVPAPHPEAFERFLFVGPHPDDIEIGAGAAAAKLAAAGKAVCFVIVTDGRYGVENLAEPIAPDELAMLRRREAVRSAAVLGVKDVRFLDLSDGGFYGERELLEKLAAVTADFQPQVIFAPDPAPANETHPDHLRVGRAAAQIACFAYNGEIMERYGAAAAPVEAVAFYMTARPNRFVGTFGYTGLQKKALAAHRTQFPEGSDAWKDIQTYLKLRAGFCGLRSGRRRAEGFRMLGKAQGHVLAEFGE